MICRMRDQDAAERSLEWFCGIYAVRIVSEIFALSEGGRQTGKRKTFAALLILAVGTEALQLALWLGRFDIDTILLFVTGGMIGYGIGNIPWFRSWFRPDVMVQPIIDSTNS